MHHYTIDHSQQGYTVLRDGQAIATFRSAGEAIEAMRQFRDRPEQARQANVPPMIRHWKQRHAHPV